MDALSPFLVGGPAFSGTTLLVVLVNGPGVVCLDEPDFEDPAQAHRNIPELRRRFPDAALPNPPGRPLDLDEAFDLVIRCAAALAPTRFGIKTCDDRFVRFARRFRDSGLPVVAIVRDIRDALVRPLPPWVTEQSLNAAYRRVWDNLGVTRTWIRYEDLVLDPGPTLARVAGALGLPSTPDPTWSSDDVPELVVKLDRHELLRSGAISPDRVGCWRGRDLVFSPTTHETARLMGYAD